MPSGRTDHACKRRAPRIALPALLFLLALAPAQLAVAARKSGLQGARYGETMTCDGKKVTIMGTPGPDVIVGKKAGDVIYGGGGNDVIYGGPNGNDTICGGPGNDVIYGGPGRDTLLGEEGDDRLSGGRGGDRLEGGEGNDRLFGGRGPDRLYGGEGDDVLFGGRATDKVIDGEGGNDRLFGGRGNDTMNGGPGTDYLDGGLGDDVLEGGPGNGDTVIGNLGTDIVNGGEGDGDVVRGDLGSDILNGGPGANDIASYVSATQPVNVNLDRGEAAGDGWDTLTEVEDVVGSPWPDTIWGDSGPNRLYGGGGYDVMGGLGGEDRLYGGLDGARCGRAPVEESCTHAPGPAPGPVVTRSDNVDGSHVLSVGGAETADEIEVSLQGESLIVTDPPNPIPPENVRGCTAVAGTAACAPDVQVLVVSPRGGNDVVRIAESVPPSIQVRINGGTGADALYGGPGGDIIEAGDDSAPDLLDGGPGNDGLIGARTDLPVPYDSGKSTLIGGPGSDLLVGGDPCDGDLFDGGPGEDTASFIRFSPGVFAEIGGEVRWASPNCTPGHISTSVEALEGSEGPDTLIGDGTDNTLSGRGGADTLIAHGGNNRLVGGAAQDRLVGSARLNSLHQ